MHELMSTLKEKKRRRRMDCRTFSQNSRMRGKCHLLTAHITDFSPHVCRLFDHTCCIYSQTIVSEQTQFVDYHLIRQKPTVSFQIGLPNGFLFFCSKQLQCFRTQFCPDPAPSSVPAQHQFCPGPAPSSVPAQHQFCPGPFMFDSDVGSHCHEKWKGHPSHGV